jgi:Uma2 family endonuclease
MTIHPMPMRLTFDDYLAFPDDGQRHEILAGEHVVSPRPNLYHQLVAVRLLEELQARIARRNLGLVYPEVTVHLDEHDVAEPDIAIVLRGNEPICKPTKIFGAPDLVIEILSPSDRRVDEVQKRGRYALAGIREYWLVDPEARSVEQLVLRDRNYESNGAFREAITASVCDARIDLTRVW